MKPNYWAIWLWFLAACACTVLAVLFALPSSVTVPFAATLLFLAMVFTVLALRSLPWEERREWAFGMCGCMVFLLLATVFAIPFLINAFTRRPTTTWCLSNIKRLNLGLIMYASDANDFLPPGSRWRTASYAYVKDHDSAGFGPLRCPDAKSPWSYGMNSAMSAKSLAKIENEADLVLLLETDSQVRDAVVGPESFVRRHNEKGSIGFADGHAASKPSSNWRGMRWQP